MASPPSLEEMDETAKQNIQKLISQIWPEFIRYFQPKIEEMLKGSETSHSFPEIQRDVHENCNIQLEEQRNEISYLSARLKKAEDELIKKDECLHDTLKEISEDTKKSLGVTDRLAIKFDLDRIKDDRLKETDALKQQIKALEKSLEKEMKFRSNLMMKINKINTTSVLEKQDECNKLVRSLIESTEENKSKLTDVLNLAEECLLSNKNSDSLPPHILGCANQIEKDLGASANNKDKVKEFGLALGLNSSTVEKIVEKSGNPFWDVIHEWNKTSQSLSILISACKKSSISSFFNCSMPPQHSKAIEKACSRLVTSILFEPLVIYLRENAVLSPTDVEYILSPKTRTEKFRRLVDILPLFGEKAFDCFVEALTKSGQSHLADILKDELKKLTPVSDTLNSEGLEQTLQSERTTDDEFHSLNERCDAYFVIGILIAFVIILYTYPLQNLNFFKGYWQ